MPDSFKESLKYFYMNTVTEFQLRNWLGDEEYDTSKSISLLLQLANEEYTLKELKEDVLSYNEDISEEELRDAFDDEE